jgi:hypothetical protein
MVGCESEADKEIKKQKNDLLIKLEYESKLECGYLVLGNYFNFFQNIVPKLDYFLKNTIDPKGGMTSLFKKRYGAEYDKYVKMVFASYKAKICENQKEIVEYRKKMTSGESLSAEAKEMQIIQFGQLCSTQFMSECFDAKFYAKKTCMDIKENTKEHEDCIKLKQPSTEQFKQMEYKHFDGLKKSKELITLMEKYKD